MSIKFRRDDAEAFAVWSGSDIRPGRSRVSVEDDGRNKEREKKREGGKKGGKKISSRTRCFVLGCIIVIECPSSILFFPFIQFDGGIG